MLPPIPGTRPHHPHPWRGRAVVVIVGRARVYVCSPQTKRFVVARQDEGDETDRYLIASDLTWRTLDMVQGQPLRWLVEVFVQDWKSPAGWSPLTKPPGEEGARKRVSLRLLVDPCLLVHPDPQAPLTHTLPASTVGSLRANVPVACLVNVIEPLVLSDAPGRPRHRFRHT